MLPMRSYAACSGDNVANLVAPVAHDDTLPWRRKESVY